MYIHFNIKFYPRAPLLPPSLPPFQIYKAFQNQVKWESESLDTFVKELSERVYIIQDKVQDALTKHEDIARHLRELGECSYSPESFRLILVEMQAKVDDMNLAEYSNLGQWTAGLNTQIEATLVQVRGGENVGT